MEKSFQKFNWTLFLIKMAALSMNSLMPGETSNSISIFGCW
uniref:Uncharacterized protein n=1 Tax=Nelumbo nucifera TaxID=4432 RepID=A0A822XZW9_NELNU|nr:TPA_asm: hypothetical protein HUJ06_024401 [Nelumbo nucifera]